MGFSSYEELENAISTCKQLIRQAPEKSQRKKDLVTQLVQLRLKLHELKVILWGFYIYNIIFHCSM